MTLTLHSDDMVEVSGDDGSIYACTEEDSNDFMEWFIGTTDKRVFENKTVFNNNGELVKLVKE